MPWASGEGHRWRCSKTVRAEASEPSTWLRRVRASMLLRRTESYSHVVFLVLHRWHVGRWPSHCRACQRRSEWRAGPGASWAGQGGRGAASREADRGRQGSVPASGGEVLSLLVGASVKGRKGKLRLLVICVSGRHCRRRQCACVFQPAREALEETSRRDGRRGLRAAEFSAACPWYAQVKEEDSGILNDSGPHRDQIESATHIRVGCRV